MRKAAEIKPGTHYRVLGQAKKNIFESLYTLVIAAQMGLIDLGEVQRLLTVVSGIPSGMEEDALAGTLEIIQAIITRIVTL